MYIICAKNMCYCKKVPNFGRICRLCAASIYKNRSADLKIKLVIIYLSKFLIPHIQFIKIILFFINYKVY